MAARPKSVRMSLSEADLDTLITVVNDVLEFEPKTEARFRKRVRLYTLRRRLQRARIALER